MSTANEKLQDAAILHATILERYKRDVAQRVIAVLNDELEPEVLGKIQAKLGSIGTRGFDKSLASTVKLRALDEAIREVIHEFSAGARKAVTAEMVKLAKAEAKWQAAALRKAIPAEIRVDLAIPSPAALRTMVNEGPVNGALLKDWFKNLDTATAKAVTTRVNVGIAQGETTQQIVARVRGTPGLGYTDGAMQGTRREIVTLTHTTATHVSAQARAQTARENRDLIKGEQWSSALDSRVCVACAPRDGKVYPVGEGQRPPLHPLCRCTMIPVLKSWQGLGYNVKDLPVGTRASMDGQVPADLTFGEWLKKQPKSRVADVLGSKGAAAKFLSGELPLDAFSTTMGTPLSLKQVMAMQD